MIQKFKKFLEFRYKRNVDYYIRAFDKLEKTGTNTFNNAAAYFGCAWMLYRKMYFYAAIAFVCQIMLTIILGFLGQTITFFGDVNAGKQIGILMSAIICIRLFGLYGNKIYYDIIKSRISKKHYAPDSHQATAFSLAVCFAIGHNSWLTLLLILPLILYFYHNDLSLKPKPTHNGNGNTKTTPDTIQQYLNKKEQLLERPAYSAYLLTVISFMIVTITLVTKPDANAALATMLSTIFPVLAG